MVILMLNSNTQQVMSMDKTHWRADSSTYFRLSGKYISIGKILYRYIQMLAEMTGPHRILNAINHAFGNASAE